MDVERGSFRSLGGIRWPVLGPARRDSPRRATQEFHEVRFRTIALYEAFKERLLVFAIITRKS
jgi:hypothetical protein